MQSSESGLNSGLAWTVIYNGQKKTVNGNQILFSFQIDNELNYTIPNVTSSVDGCPITFIPSISSGSEIVGGSVNVNFVPVESEDCIKFDSYYTVGSKNTFLNYSINTKGNSTVILSLTNGNSGIIGFSLPKNCIQLQNPNPDYNDLYYCIEAPGNYSIDLNTGTSSNELAAAYVFNGTNYSIVSSSNAVNSNNNYGNVRGTNLPTYYPLVFCSTGGNSDSPITQNGSILSSPNAAFWYMVDASSCSQHSNYNSASVTAFAVMPASTAPVQQSLTTTFTESGLNVSTNWTVDLDGYKYNSTSSSIKLSTKIDNELNYSIPNISLSSNNCTTTFTPSISNGSIISGGLVSIKFSYDRTCS